MRKALGRAEIQAKLEEWRAALLKRGILDAIGFAQDDPFQAGAVSASNLIAKNTNWETNWVPLSQLPAGIQTAINQDAASRAQSLIDIQRNNPKFHPPVKNDIPIPELQGQARVTVAVSYRFLLPDGRPLESQKFNPSGSTTILNGTTPGEKPALPVEITKLPAGSGVGIKSDDPQAVTKLCRELKEFSVPEIWLESQSPAAIRAAIDSGLVVDLVIHPWRVLKGENCPDIDRNILGQTGLQVNEIQAVRLDSKTQRVYSFANCFSPADPNIGNHWSRLLTLIPKQGIHRIVLLEPEPRGYEASSGNFGSIGSELGPLTQFGYDTDLRLGFLRKHQIDPVDVVQPHRVLVAPPSPYFDRAGFGPRAFGPYPGVHFPRVMGLMDDSIFSDWQSVRHASVAAPLSELVSKLSSVVNSVFLETLSPQDFPAPLLRSAIEGPLGKPVDWKNGLYVNILTMNALNTENEQGELVWQPRVWFEKPICFDLGEVPPERIRSYLKYIFKSPR